MQTHHHRERERCTTMHSYMCHTSSLLSPPSPSPSASDVLSQLILFRSGQLNDAGWAAANPPLPLNFPPPIQNNFLHVDKWRAAWCCQSSMAQQTPVTRQRWWHGVARGRHECGKEPPTDAGGWHVLTPITPRSMVGCDGSYPSTQLCPQRLGQLPWSVFCPKAIQILAPLFVCRA